MIKIDIVQILMLQLNNQIVKLNLILIRTKFKLPSNDQRNQYQLQ